MREKTSTGCLLHAPSTRACALTGNWTVTCLVHKSMLNHWAALVRLDQTWVLRGHQMLWHQHHVCPSCNPCKFQHCGPLQVTFILYYEKYTFYVLLLFIICLLFQEYKLSEDKLLFKITAIPPDLKQTIPSTLQELNDYLLNTLIKRDISEGTVQIF